MTGLALDFRMSVPQGEIRVLAMIERRRIPAIGIMAVLALLTVSSRMTVVAAMARDTGLFKLLLFQRATMALFARQALVLAQQRKVGLASVVEPYLIPAVRHVAVLALATVITAMNVIDRVTGDTLQRRLLISLVDVTASAGGVGVFTSEREVGAVVVELYSSPFIRDMTGCTVLTEATTVRVALPMAVHTA